MKALEYKADFTLIEQIVKSLEDIKVSFRNIIVNLTRFLLFQQGRLNHVFPSLPMHTLLSSKFPREI
jgi:hypothetical protein